ncbi:cytochrome c peroxidase [Aeromonas sp. D3]|uniref:cytochrome c peroxidase n=1 Tax=Aeromonas sp. D3 TaxID=2990474 RepID=UPI0022E780C9|nr:cytochrome c peroxidase [Aeromonas sp. D3]
MKAGIYFLLTAAILAGCNSDTKPTTNTGTGTGTGTLPSQPPQILPISFIVSVPESLKTTLAGGLVSARQLNTKKTYQSTLDSNSTATFIVDSYNDSYPFEITISNNNQIFKVLSSQPNLMRAQTERIDSNTVNVLVTPETTAQFAYLDENQDGMLSTDEVQNLSTKLAEAESKGLAFIFAALEIYGINESIEGTQAINSYRLALDMFRSESLLNIIKVRNQREIKRILDRDRPSEVLIDDPNPESDSFLRIDQTGKLLSSQNNEYSTLSWQCVDDLRSRSKPLRNYGYGVNIWHYSDKETANIEYNWSDVENKLNSLNQQSMCNVGNWSVPTVEELESLLDSNAAKFPLSFPFLTSNFYWVNKDNSRATLNQRIYDISAGALVDDPTQTTAAVLYKSFTRLDKTSLQRQVDQTPDEIKAAYTNVKALYANPDPATWPAPIVDNDVEWAELGILPNVEHPNYNQYSINAHSLGKRLFFEPRLSKNRDISCSTCHTPSQGWDDNLTVSVGHNGEKGTRNAPSIINSAFQTSLFWDGGATNLEEQALKPIANPIEMNLPIEELEDRVSKGLFDDYSSDTLAAFGSDHLTTEIIAKSLAMFQRSIISTDAKFDRFLKGEATLTNQELWGLHLFRTKAKCMNCHSGPNFTNNDFEDIGLSDYNLPARDLGRYNVTLNPEDSGKFKVASLRELAHTAPYMHTGRFDLEEVITAYNNAMGVKIVASKLKINEYRYDPLFPEGSGKLHVLNLTKSEISAIVDFLETLSSSTPPIAK